MHTRGMCSSPAQFIRETRCAREAANEEGAHGCPLLKILVACGEIVKKPLHLQNDPWKALKLTKTYQKILGCSEIAHMPFFP